MVLANGGLPAHRYTPQVTPRWPRGSEPASYLSVSCGGFFSYACRLFVRSLSHSARAAVCIPSPICNNHLPQSRATNEIVRAAIMFSLLKYFFTYSAIIAIKFGHFIPEGLKMMILFFFASIIQNWVGVAYWATIVHSKGSRSFVVASFGEWRLSGHILDAI